MLISATESIFHTGLISLNALRYPCITADATISERKSNVGYDLQLAYPCRSVKSHLVHLGMKQIAVFENGASIDKIITDYRKSYHAYAVPTDIVIEEFK